jgi:oligopeptidase B
MNNNELNSNTLEHPTAIKRPTILQKHGHQRVDNYFWMRLTDEQKSSKNPDEQTTEVIKYLEAENTYRENYWKSIKDFENKLYEEIVGRIKQTDMSVPYKNRGFWYINRFEEGKEYVIRSRKKETLEATEEILLDENVLSINKAYFATTGHTISNDNNLLAYGEDINGRRQYTIKIKDISKNVYLYDEIKDTSGNIVWANDNSTIFYTKNDETLRSYKIYRHKIGTDASEDLEVYHEKDETFHCFVYKSRSKKYIIFGSGTTVSNEYSIIPADSPFSEPILFQSRERNHEFSIDHFNGMWYIRTNKENAFNFKLMTTEENQLQKEYWKDFILHREDVLIEGFNLFNNFLVISERINGITNICVQKWNGESSYINFGEESYMAMTSVNPDPDSLTLRLEYTSMTTPATSFEYNMETGELKILKEQEIVGGYNKNEYVSKRLYAEASDGVKIPISLVYNKSFENLETMPVLIYGYGSYGISIDPSFSSSRISLLDRGIAFAIAHIRGGEDLGRKWYENGKLLNKKNTFNDFIACADFLINVGLTSSDQLFAMGGSAGGLLIGAVINERPKLWKAAIAAVPFFDVVTTMLDETIPLTTGEYDEWGNPNEKEFYDYMLSYSPYDNIETKDYPALLITTGYHDSQVQYWEPAKYTAKMREFKTDSNPLLFYCNMSVGHGGASGRFERYREIAMEYTFILDQAGKIT